MREILVWGGSLLTVAAVFPYIWSIVYGSVRPQRMTRFLLAVVTGLSFMALLAGDDHTGLWLAFASFIESLLLLGVSFWRGMGGRSRLDMVCLGLCALGIAWWLLSGESLVGLIASIIADLVACMPSLVKAIRLPHTDSAWFYLSGVVAGGCVLAAGPYDWKTMLFPTYLSLINAAYVLAIWRPMIRRVRESSADIL